MDRREPCPKLTTRQRNPDLNRSGRTQIAPTRTCFRRVSGFSGKPGSFLFFWFLYAISGFLVRSLAKKSSPAASRRARFRFACRSFSSMTILVFWRLRRLVSFPE